jgi:hypothetical protein
MKSNKWLLLIISFLAIVLNNFALAEGDGGNGGDDYDGDGHNNGDDHHYHDHNHLTFGIGGYYDPWFWGGYGYYNPGFWGNYYGPVFYSPYGYRAYGHADPFFRPYYTYPPVVTAPSRSPVYIQQPEPKLAQPKTNYWYYCQYPQGYYPHIKECPGGWTQVAPQPQTQ